MTSFFGLVLYAALWIMHFILRTLLRFSIDIEEEELNDRKDEARLEVVETIGVLRALEAINSTIFASIIPVASVVLGMIMPQAAREFLSDFVGPTTLVAVTVVALFAYGSVFIIWKRHEGQKVYDALKRTFRPRRAQEAKPELSEPSTA